MPRPTIPASRLSAPLAVCAGLGLALLATNLAGCKSSPKKSAPPPGATGGADTTGDPFWMPPPNRPASPSANAPASMPAHTNSYDPRTSTADSTGILAGRVVDQGFRTPGVANIQVQPAGGGGGPPVDIQTTREGHFTVRGLVNGQSYRLFAKTMVGQQVLVGEVFARPPDARLLIPVSAEFASSNQPPMRDPPVNGGEAGGPRPNSDYFPPPAPEFIAGNESANIPKANINSPPGLPNTAAPVQGEGFRPAGPVPDCLVANGRVLTLRLFDTEGRVWDMAQRNGRLVLIDLWGSWCTPCVRAIPELVRLQGTYRTRGLEVIGIACEKGSAEENLQRVHSVQSKFTNINYRILMAGESANDPVRAQFRPAAYPSLVLLDSDGTILWRGVGGDSIGELESIIRARLPQ